MHAITGLRIRDGIVEWTLLREDGDGSVQRVSKSVLLEKSLADDPARVADEIRRLCPDLVGPVTVGMASDQVLMRVVDLPTVDGNEINGMAQLQMDKLSPFPADKMASSFEVLKASEDSSRVLLATIRRSAIEWIGEICGKAGLDILRIDLDVMGCWKSLCEANAVLASGRQVMIILERAGGVIMAAHDGVPVSFKPIGPSEDLSAEDYAAEIAGETGALMLALDLEYGEIPIARLDLLYQGEEPAQIIKRLNQELGADPEVKPLSSFPPITEGLARRAMESSFSIRAAPARGIGSVMDLVPTAWRVSAANALLKQRMIAALAVIIGIWIIGMTALGMAYNARQRRFHNVEQRMAMLQEPADEARALQRRVNSFEQYIDRKRSVLECLLEIDRMRPTDVKLTSFQFRKGRNVLVRGESLVVDPIIDFKQRLDSSALFETIEMGAIQPRKRKDQTVQTFQMNARMPEQTP